MIAIANIWYCRWILSHSLFVWRSWSARSSGGGTLDQCLPEGEQEESQFISNPFQQNVAKGHLS